MYFWSSQKCVTFDDEANLYPCGTYHLQLNWSHFFPHFAVNLDICPVERFSDCCIKQGNPTLHSIKNEKPQSRQLPLLVRFDEAASQFCFSTDVEMSPPISDHP